MTKVRTTGQTSEKTSQEVTQHQKKDRGMLLRVGHISPLRTPSCMRKQRRRACIGSQC